MDILQETVLKCLFSFAKHNIRVEASCSGLGLASFKFKKGQQVQEKGHSNRGEKQEQPEEHRELSRSATLRDVSTDGGRREMFKML